MCLYALTGGTGTVLNVSISKLAQLEMGTAPRLILVSLYLLLACLTIVVQAVANGRLSDPSLFVPVSCGVNLWLNFAAGMCIWGDAGRLQAPISYVSVFVLVFLGTYGVSSFDFVSTPFKMNEDGNKIVARGLAGPGKPIRSYANPFAAHLDYSRDPLRLAGVELRKSWDVEASNQCQCRDALKRFLQHATNRSLVDAHSLGELCLQLLDERCEQQGSKSEKYHSQALERWLLNKVEAFKDCGP
jgi:hypothetical protein